MGISDDIGLAPPRYSSQILKNLTQTMIGGMSAAASRIQEIDKSFMNGVDSTLAMVALSDLEFPGVYVWEEGGKAKIETEGDYNERAAVEQGFFLLDKKLVKCTQTTSPIELCDLLTQDKQLVHVKHRKGGSAGLSHLFSQGSVSAEVMLGDKGFRKKARTVLRRVNPRARDLVPLNVVCRMIR